MLWSWDTEGTMWLPGDFVRAGALPEPVGPDASEFGVARPLMENELGMPDWPPDAGSIHYCG